MTSWLPRIDLTQCIGCGECVVTCPNAALGIVSKKAVLTAPEACNYCADCEEICPTHAIALPYQICFNPSDNKKDQ
jgi:NAD-dependent dihydropyrimidine dehydrogenase PreA subunit